MKKTKKRKRQKEYMVIVAGKVAPQVKNDLVGVLKHMKWTESQYVREAVMEKVERDKATIAA
jgi:hypothetical protein